MWTAGRNDDGVEQGLVRQPLGAVAADDLNIVVAEPLQARARLVGEFLVALDGVDLVGDAAEHGRGIAGPCADLENLIAGLNFGEFEHAGDDIRLRDGLAGLDGERGVLIGELLQGLGDEGFARHLAHGGKRIGVGDAAGLKMPRHHDGAVPGMLVVAVDKLEVRGCHAS